jgi:hypothetical protein
MPRTQISKRYRFLKLCFGRGKRNCSCPPLLKPLCRKYRLSDHRSPIPLRAGKGERIIGYTAIDNRIFRPWFLGEREPPDGVKLTYLYLISRADKIIRWVCGRPEKRAQERGIPVRTYVEHLKVLEGLSLVLRVPHCYVSQGSCRRYMTVILLDLPRGMNDVSEEQDAEIDAHGAEAAASRGEDEPFQDGEVGDEEDTPELDPGHVVDDPNTTIRSVGLFDDDFLASNPGPQASARIESEAAEDDDDYEVIDPPPGMTAPPGGFLYRLNGKIYTWDPSMGEDLSHLDDPKPGEHSAPDPAAATVVRQNGTATPARSRLPDQYPSQAVIDKRMEAFRRSRRGLS